MILARIVEEKRKAVEEAKRSKPVGDLIRELAGVTVRSAFKKSIARAHHVNLIAEIKKASPSRGIIRRDFDPAKIGAAYQANGAAALSVLTDERFFGGRLEYIKLVKEHTTLPVLRKDFIIDEYQVYESAAAGADAILLIAELLAPGEMKGLYDLATSLGLDALLEAHSGEDIEKALATGGDIIGINNRDLHLFTVDIGVTQKLIRMIPAGKITVSESGIRTHADIMFLKSLGVNAALIGGTFMEADDIGAKVRELIG